MDWAKNFTGDLKIVFYDDLVKNVEESLRDILRFINYNIDEVSECFQKSLPKLSSKTIFPGFVELRDVAKGRNFP